MAPCFQIHRDDNAAVMLADGATGQWAQVVGGVGLPTVRLRQSVPYGHKVALADLQTGDPVIKYGIAIGHATCPIRAGEWIHLHNCASNYDERSATLEVASGRPTDTEYR